MYMSSKLGVDCLKTFGGDSAKLSLTNLPTNSLWFKHFALGCLRRMGQDVHRDWVIPVDTIHALMRMLDREWDRARDWVHWHLLATVGAYIIIAFCGSFHGNEVFFTDLYGLAKYLRELPGEDHVIVPLLGRYKREMHQRYHLTPLAATTNSGMPVRYWLVRLAEVWREAGCTHGPAFGTQEGVVLEASFIEEKIVDLLHEIRVAEPSSVPANVDFGEEFGISRSF